eukprot:47560-Pyramimonas_sp.AAC.1
MPTWARWCHARSHWGLRGAPLWGHETCEGCAKRVMGVSTWAQWCHASAATGAFGRAPYETTKRVRSVPKW